MDAPAAIYVLTNEDLRRQGAVSLPEALRSVPGLHVARFTASSWIVASRGFASTSANKMLVMIDGRSVYSPLFSGVFWDQQDTMLLDVDRVEVTRGPGASLWGSNAVNGVINVVSKRAADTQGSLVMLGGGAEEQLFTAGRYGGRASSGHYRVYGKYFQRDAANILNDVDAEDGQRLGQGGFRFDVGGPSNAFTIQGDGYASRGELAGRADIRANGANVLGRWIRQTSSTTQLQLHTYVDRTHRFVQNQFEERRTTFDVELQHHWSPAAAHTVNYGGGYRLSADDTVPSPLLFFDPAQRTTHLFAAFVQDEIQLASTTRAIVGTKIERNSYTGIEWQPSGRLLWTPSPRQTLWGAVSRGVRMPTRFDTDLRINLAPPLRIEGTEDFSSETLVAFEAGYRVAPHPILAVDLTAFHNRYNNLRTQEPTGTRILIGNGLNDRSNGFTMSGSVQPRQWARLSASYTFLSHDLFLDADSQDLGRGLLETIDPRHFGRLSGRFDLPHDVELDFTSNFVGQLRQGTARIPPTPGYAEAGFRVGWRVSPNVEVSLIGRDVLHDDHVEFISPSSDRVVRIERSLYTRLLFVF